MSSTVRVHPDVIVYRSSPQAHTTEVSCPVPDRAFSALPTVHGASVVSAPSIVYGPRFISSSQTVVIPGYPYVINTGRIYMDPTVATLVLCEETHQAAPVTPVSAPTPVEMMEMWIAIGGESTEFSEAKLIALQENALRLSLEKSDHELALKLDMENRDHELALKLASSTGGDDDEKKDD